MPTNLSESNFDCHGCNSLNRGCCGGEWALGWATCQFSYAMLHNDANKTTPPPPNYMRHFQIFSKIDSFIKMFQMFLKAKIVDYIFEEWLNLHILVGQRKKSLSLWILGENRTKLKKLFNLNSRLIWGAQYPRYAEYIYYYSYQRLQ